MINTVKKSKIKYIGFLILISGILYLIYIHVNNKILDIQENIKIDNFFKEEIFHNKQDNTSKKTIISNKDKYIGILEIPSISLKRGLVSINSYYNNVNYNIEIIKNSTMPNVEKGNLILAGHSGASYISFFKNLHKLNIGTKIYIYYQNFKYEYILDNIYDTPKDGEIEIERDNNKTTITLITCNKNKKDAQTVYIGYLNNKKSISN